MLTSQVRSVLLLIHDTEGYVNINHEDMEELLWEERLNEEELVKIIEESIPNAFVEENMDNKCILNLSYDVKPSWKSVKMPLHSK
ncbi:hypothetical protein NPIL_485871 [Nephila pilipes]|uniref:Uncharacterized protein n=1 Tax=Nephila pilipes TaxID=299642 RepID=A0A8X6TIT4_NEPPI|nr:hypothetical protein NPIL_485871 [Nephila pilipes]